MIKILIISSDFSLTTMMEARLLIEGHEVFKAEDGLLGFQKIKELKPQLIILDVVLSKMSAHQLLEKTRALPDFLRTPVMVIADPAWTELFDKADIFYLCSKPILCGEFMKKVALAGKRVEKETPQPQAEAVKIPSGQGRVLLGGRQEFILKKLQKFFESQGFTVECYTNEEELVRKALEMRPHYIFVQYWENTNIFNIRKIEQSLVEIPELRKIPFYVFCNANLAAYAREATDPDHVFFYCESQDLLVSLKKLISRGKKGAA